MHTPLKKTFDNPEYLARSRKYDHKCACEICTCGKDLAMQENIAVLSQDRSSKGKPPTVTFTDPTRCKHSGKRNSQTCTYKPTTTQTLSSRATRPLTPHIRCKRKNQLCKKAFMSLQKHPSKEKASTRRATCQTRPNLSVLTPPQARNMPQIQQGSKTPPHTIESILPKRLIILLRLSGKPITTSRPRPISKVKQTTRHHSNHTRSSLSAQRLATSAEADLHQPM